MARTLATGHKQFPASSSPTHLPTILLSRRCFAAWSRSSSRMQGSACSAAYGSCQRQRFLCAPVPPRTMSTRFGSPPVPYSQPLAASPASTSAPPLLSPASAQQLPFPASYNPYYHTSHQSYSTPNSSHTYSYHPMTMLPPRYYPPVPNNQNGNR
jgi:hypothetical protein